MHWRAVLLLLCAGGVTLIVLGCAAIRGRRAPVATPATVPGTVPVTAAGGLQIEREFRGAWVATVANIDWPSAPGLTVGRQQQEALEIVEAAAAAGLNAILLQVRPQCDALYASTLEPWSYFLTGTQGLAPKPFYDPLAFWVREAHARGLELHAWLNPYRAHHPSGGPVADASLVRQRPDLVVALESGYYWLDPARRGTQDHVYAVVMDVLRRYDVDGIHFDDYFYPYPSYNANRDFPDERSWQEYRSSGGRLSRPDWRRDQVNRFVRRVYRGIKREKPYVKFGISPFGIWRPGNPATIRGFDPYDGLYADALEWFRAGWVDYLMPQLYWPINRVEQSYPVLLGWWARQNVHGRHLWPGLMTSDVKSERGVDENLNQIMVARGFVPEAPGHAHFSMKALRDDRHGLVAALRAGPYARPALVPASPWLQARPPTAPLVSVRQAADSLVVDWQHDAAETVFRWVVAYRQPRGWTYQLCPGPQRSLALACPLGVAAREAPDASPSVPVGQTQGGGARIVAGRAQGAGTAALQLDRVAAGTAVLVMAVDRLGNMSAPGQIASP
jgi:uncharacterized lipoprotein YddW (UPF0748 family)